MHVALVSYEYPPQSGLGGVGTYAARLATALGQAGHRVSVLAGPATAPDAAPPNVTIHRLPAHYHPKTKLARAIYYRLATLAGKAHPIVAHWMRWNLATPAALLDVHRQTPIDVVEAPEHAANGLFVARTNRWPTVLRVHGPWDLFYGLNRTSGTAMNRLLTHAERLSLRYADALTTPSQTMADMIARKWRLPVPPTAIPNFMDVPAEPAPLPPTTDPQRIVCAGRLEGFKGQDTLVRAFASIAPRHPTAELHLIGPDQWAKTFTFAQLADRLAPDPATRRRIHLHGPQPLATVQAELRRAAIAVIPSTGFESFSFSTLEAMAHARPIVGSRAGAIPELLAQGGCGLLADPNDPAQFAAALDRLLSDRARAQHLGQSAHARARAQYDTPAVIPQMLAQFERARALHARKA